MVNEIRLAASQGRRVVTVAAFVGESDAAHAARWAAHNRALGYTVRPAAGEMAPHVVVVNGRPVAR